MKRVVAALLLLSVTACGARSVTTMEQQPPTYVTITKKSPAAFTACIAPKIEAYPVMTGFAIEDRTAPALTRQTDKGADIYQMMNTEIMTLVTVRRSQNANKVALFVTPYHVGVVRVKAAFTRLINSCR